MKYPAVGATSNPETMATQEQGQCCQVSLLICLNLDKTLIFHPPEILLWLLICSIIVSVMAKPVGQQPTRPDTDDLSLINALHDKNAAKCLNSNISHWGLVRDGKALNI